MKHREVHPIYVEGCFGCKVQTVGVAASAMENRGAAVREADAKDKALSKDLDSYKRLRANGLQPKNIDGSAALESSDMRSQFDIDLGRIVPKSEESRVREGFEMAKEMGL